MFTAAPTLPAHLCIGAAEALAARQVYEVQLAAQGRACGARRGGQQRARGGDVCWGARASVRVRVCLRRWEGHDSCTTLPVGRGQGVVADCAGGRGPGSRVGHTHVCAWGGKGVQQAKLPLPPAPLRRPLHCVGRCPAGRRRLQHAIISALVAGRTRLPAPPRPSEPTAARNARCAAACDVAGTAAAGPHLLHARLVPAMQQARASTSTSAAGGPHLLHGLCP